jgi:hypothetical protein
VTMDPSVPDSKSDFFQTPNIERLATGGMRFCQAYASHCNCSPSRAALLTGRSPTALHLTDIVDRDSGPFYTGNYLTPPDHATKLSRAAARPTTDSINRTGPLGTPMETPTTRTIRNIFSPSPAARSTL